MASEQRTEGWGTRRLRGWRRLPPARWLAAAALIPAVSLGIALMPVPGSATPSIMPSREIAVGMKGVGKTVVIGTSVVDFQVQVLGILRNAGPAGDLVLFRASGPMIQRVGGIAAGMSGSPIYLQGRLAGALAYTFQSADPMVGLFTPIEDMLRVLPSAPRQGAVPPLPRLTRGELRVRIDGRTLVAAPAETPLFVSGFAAAQQESLSHALAPMGLVPMAGGSQASIPASLPLEPGSAIGVALLQGDISAYAIGTMTYRDGSRMLAFGHPFTGIGPSSYLLMNAKIFEIIRGQRQNIKVGAVGVPVGIVSQDRPAGIGGLIGTMPRMFGVHVHVLDGDSGVERDFHFQVIPSAEIAPVVVPIGSQGAIERALNRSGQGTARVRMVLYARDLPRPIVRENMFYGQAGIAARALAELPQAMQLLFDNDFKDVGPSAIDLNVRIGSAQQTATIVEAEAPRDPVAPGGTVRVRVTLRPFRAAPETHEIVLTIPANAVSGSALLGVRGGGSTAGSGPAGALPGGGVQGTPPRSLDDAIKAFETGDKNTDVVVELMGGMPSRPESGSALPARPSAQWTTPWVVRGRMQVPITIKGDTH